MFHLLVLATVLTACVAVEVAQPTSPEILIRNDYHRFESQRLRHDLERLRHDLNIPSNPHQHLDDPYRRDNMRHLEKYDNRRDGYDNVRDKYDHRRDEYDERRDEYDERRDEFDERRDEFDERRNDKGRGRDDWREHREKQWWTDKDQIKHVDDDHEIDGPVILRHIKSHNDKRTLDIARQNKIVADVYSPDYAQPTWVIDYRYLKTGGRDYTRGPGGQIVILPKGIRTNEHKEFKDYDEMIEHLRQKNLVERSKPQYFMPLGQEIHQHHEHDRSRWHN